MKNKITYKKVLQIADSKERMFQVFLNGELVGVIWTHVQSHTIWCNGVYCSKNKKRCAEYLIELMKNK